MSFDFGDYDVDDEEFANGAAVNKITEAYAKVFENIEEIAKDAKECVRGGATKEILNAIGKIGNKIATLTEITNIEKYVRGESGALFNILGEEVDEFAEDFVDNGEMSETDMENKLDDIIKSTTAYNYYEAREQNAKNVTDDGESHGDIDDINW